MPDQKPTRHLRIDVAAIHAEYALVKDQSDDFIQSWKLAKEVEYDRIMADAERLNENETLRQEARSMELEGLREIRQEAINVRIENSDLAESPGYLLWDCNSFTSAMDKTAVLTDRSWNILYNILYNKLKEELRANEERRESERAACAARLAEERKIREEQARVARVQAEQARKEAEQAKQQAARQAKAEGFDEWMKRNAGWVGKGLEVLTRPSRSGTVPGRFWWRVMSS